MTAHENRVVLQNYRSFLRKNNKTFPCPICQDSVSCLNFENHCSSEHKSNARRCCVWCLGKRVWPTKEKHKNVDHLKQCFLKFIKLNIQPCPDPAEPLNDESSNMELFNIESSFDSTPMAEKRNFFHHQFEPEPRSCQLIWPMPLDPNPLTFQDESLNRAISYIQKYIELGNETEWFHASVRMVGFSSFLNVMDLDRGQSRTLTFSCWCNGGSPTFPRWRQHRHMIIVSSPPGHFTKDVWKKIIPDERVPKNFRCVHLEPIRDVMHLVNMIGYVSSRKSQCQFSRDYKKSPSKDNHFYLFESLPKDYRLPLVLQWNDGILQLLDQEFKNFKLGTLTRSRLFYRDQKWRFQIKNIPGIKLGMILPVSRDLKPCFYQTDLVLHLVNGRKMYFERDPSLCYWNPEDWLQKQAEMGNLFHHVIGEEHWTPRPYHQKVLNEFKPLVNRIGELESEKRCKRKLELENESLRKEIRDVYKGELKKLKIENDSLKKVGEMKKEEWERVVHDVKKKNEEWERVVHDVKKKNEELERVINEMKMENEELKIQIKLQGEDIKRLKIENVKREMRALQQATHPISININNN